MDSPKKDTLSRRWLGPMAVTILGLLCLLYKSPSPDLLSRYSWNFVAFLGLMLLWVVVSWWIALSGDRWDRLCSRLRAAPVIQLLLIALVCVGLLDLATGFVYDWYQVTRHHLVLSVQLAVGLVVVAMWVLSATRPSKVLSRIALVLVAAGAILVAAEAVFRLVLLEPALPQTEVDFERRISANWPRPIPVEKPREAFRILGLAGSFGQNAGYANYHYRLEELLRQESSRYEVVNLSSHQYELPDELVMLQRFGLRYQPDLLLHGFFVGNDFRAPGGEPLTFKGISVRAAEGLDAVRPNKLCVKGWLHNFWLATRDRPGKERRREPMGVHARDEFLLIEAARLRNTCYVYLNETREWAKAMAVLDRTREEVTRAGAQYVMVIHPAQFQVEPHVRTALSGRHRIDLGDYDMRKPQRFLGQYCKSRGVPCIDLLAAFEARGSEGGLFGSDDAHYNEKGNRLAASEILESLLGNELLTRRPD